MTRHALHSLLNQPEALVLPGVWDPLSALLAERAGFSSVFLSGFALAGTHLGVPDIGILGFSEVADAAQRVCAAVPDINVIVDADTGYGDVDAVVHTVHTWEQAGAAGIFLEDQVWPKKCGHMDGKEVVEVGEWLAKLSAALRERNNLFVTARTDARAVLGLDVAIERGRMARDLGVDAVFVEAPQSVDELETIARELTGVHLVANMVEKGKTPLLTSQELKDMGFSIVLSPLSGLLAASQAIETAYRTLRTEGSLRDHLHTLTGFSEFTEMVAE